MKAFTIQLDEQMVEELEKAAARVNANPDLLNHQGLKKFKKQGQVSRQTLIAAGCALILDALARP